MTKNLRKELTGSSSVQIGCLEGICKGEMVGHWKHIKESEMAVFPDESGMKMNFREGRAISLYRFALGEGPGDCPDRVNNVFKRILGNSERIYRYNQAGRDMMNTVQERTKASRMREYLTCGLADEVNVTKGGR